MAVTMVFVPEQHVFVPEQHVAGVDHYEQTRRRLDAIIKRTAKKSEKE